MKLAESAGPNTCGLPGVEKRMLCALEARLRPESGVERLDHAFREREAAFGDADDMEPLVRKVAVREIDTCDLEERDLVDSGVHVAAGRLDEAREQGGPESRQLDGNRFRQLPRGLVVLNKGRRVRLREAQPDERVLDPAAQLLLAREAAEHRAANGQRERHVFEP